MGLLNIFKSGEKSGKKAADRLKIILVQDRMKVSPHVIESLKQELLKVVSKYMEIDMDGIEIDIDGNHAETTGEHPTLIANIPITGLKRN